MKTQSIFSKKGISVLVLFLMVFSLSVHAQVTKKAATMKDCCMMKDGKTMPMEKDMVMKNGTICMTNGECKMKDGTKMMMKNGDRMFMSGKMQTDKMSKMKTAHKMAAMDYSCPMHPNVKSAKAGKCPKCGMDMVKK
jgi:hypothetical protein